MLAKIYLPSDMARMVFAVLRGGPNADDTAIAVAIGAIKMTPRMAVGYVDDPSQVLSILNCLFNMLIGMAGSSHPGDFSVVLTTVKRNSCKPAQQA
jgi:hypothetical protein